MPSAPWFGWPAIFAFGLLLSVCLASASGRVGSGDTGAQLTAAVQFVNHGTLGFDRPPQIGLGLWVPSPAGQYYECHDLASQLVLVPAAALSRGVDAATETPRLATKVAVSLTYALIGALTTWLVYQALVPDAGHRRAVVLALVFCTATLYWAYVKTAWDVSGGAMGTAGLMAVLARSRSAGRMRWTTVTGIAAWVAVACGFRYSLLPFLVVIICGVAWRRRVTVPWRSWLGVAALTVLFLCPAFAFNAIRTGHYVQPATMVPQFDAANGLHGNTAIGLYGLLFSPNRGLVWFAPVFALLAMLPWVYRRLPSAIGELTLPGLAGSAAYASMIATMGGWGTFGWGDRYWVPVLPILFLPVAGTLLTLRPRHRAWCIGLVAAGVLINGAAVVGNWHSVLSQNPDALYALNPMPAEQLAQWREVARGLSGRGIHETGVLDDQYARFPDLLVARLAESSVRGRVMAGLLALCEAAAVVGFGYLAARTGWPERRATRLN